ncbi:MAG: hypothetical protein PHG08_00425 [Bacilli bacterium]|nr:hypothetical protein [Bacilli bacterium]
MSNENWKTQYIEKLLEGFLGFGEKKEVKKLPVKKRSAIVNDTRTDDQMNVDLEKKKSRVNRGVDRSEKPDWTF